jgi:FkbM family methyltransferase
MSLKRRLYGLPVMRLYRELRTAKLASKPVDTAYGFRFAGNPAYLSPGWEPNEQRIVTSLLPKVTAFVDVGANHGFYTALAAHAGVQTVAIEPEEGNLRFLKATVAANRFPTEILPVALSDAPGVLDLFGDGDTASVVQAWGSTRPSFHQLVPANTLDNLLGARWPNERILIKIDVEGAEARVLAGAAAMIARTPRPYWLIETFPNVFGSNEKTSAFLQVFDAMAGYSVFLANGRQTPVTPDLIEAWAADPRFKGRGNSNFLFVPKEDAENLELTAENRPLALMHSAD